MVLYQIKAMPLTEQQKQIICLISAYFVHSGYLEDESHLKYLLRYNNTEHDQSKELRDLKDTIYNHDKTCTILGGQERKEVQLFESLDPQKKLELTQKGLIKAVTGEEYSLTVIKKEEYLTDINNSFTIVKDRIISKAKLGNYITTMIANVLKKEIEPIVVKEMKSSRYINRNNILYQEIIESLISPYNNIKNNNLSNIRQSLHNGRILKYLPISSEDIKEAFDKKEIENIIKSGIREVFKDKVNSEDNYNNLLINHGINTFDNINYQLSRLKLRFAEPGTVEERNFNQPKSYLSPANLLIGISSLVSNYYFLSNFLLPKDPNHDQEISNDIANQSTLAMQSMVAIASLALSLNNLKAFNDLPESISYNLSYKSIMLISVSLVGITSCIANLNNNRELNNNGKVKINPYYAFTPIISFCLAIKSVYNYIIGGENEMPDNSINTLRAQQLLTAIREPRGA